MGDFSIAFHNLVAISIPNTTWESHLSCAHTGSVHRRLTGRRTASVTAAFMVTEADEEKADSCRGRENMLHMMLINELI